MMKAGMCAVVCLATTLGGWVVAPAQAQDEPSTEQMKKMYDDALQQLKAAQERKNQLAAENEKLKKQIEGLNDEIAGIKAEVQNLREVDAAHAERTFFLRSHYMAWQSFAKMNPETAGRWKLFLESAYLLSPKERVSLVDREWPARFAEPAGTQPSTNPATQPADTQPAESPGTAPAQPAASVPTQPVPTQPAVSPATQPAEASPATQPAGGKNP